MATERLRTIKPAGQGGDYTSLSAWEAGEQADLVALDEYRVGEIQGDWSETTTTGVTIDGWTTDETRNIIIRTDSANRASADWSTSKFRISTSSGDGFLILEYWVTIIGIQAESTNTTSTARYMFNPVPVGSTGSIIIFDSCYAKNTGGGQGHGFRVRFMGTGTYIRIINCIAHGWNYDDFSTGFVTESASSANRLYVTAYNCTAYRCSIGFSADIDASYTRTWKNCLAQACLNGFSIASSADNTGLNNCSDIASDAYGSSPITGTVAFLDAENGDLRLSPYDTVAQFGGTNLYADATYPVTTDIAGNSRGGTSASFDIGASHATTSIRRIMESGGDYTSLAAWESAQQRDLPANNKIAVGEIDGVWTGADTTVAIDGWTTDETRYIKIRTVGQARHNGKWSTTAYRIIANAGILISLYESATIIDGLQLRNTIMTDQSYRYGIRATSSWIGAINIGNCIIDFDTSASTNASWLAGIYIESFTNQGRYTIYNCIATGIKTKGVNGDNKAVGFNIPTDGYGYRRLYNCTAYGCDVGFLGESSNGGSYSPILINCVAQNCTKAAGFIGTFNALSDYNISDNGTVPGDHSFLGTVSFVDTTNSNFHLSPTDTTARRNGINLSNDATYPFNHDIDGRERVGDWDIGADQVTADRLFRVSKLRNVKKIYGGVS